MAEMLLVANPHRRKRRRRHRARNPRGRHHRARRGNPLRRFRRRRHSNPSFRGVVGGIMPTVKAGLVGAGGALALDAVWGRFGPMLPSSLSNTYVQFAVKALLASAIGMFGGKILRGKGRDLAVGAMTVATHDLLKTTLQQAMPTVFGTGGPLALSGYGTYLSGSAPIVGTATFPRTYSPRMNTSGFGTYLSGDNASGSGMYCDDAMGVDPWNSSLSD